MLRVSIITSVILIALILFIGTNINASVTIEDTSKIKEYTQTDNQKPIVLLIVDSLMSEPLEQLISEGKAPALTFLKENGQYYPELVSSYPTMSVTIDSSLLTGTYADIHKLPGLVWFSTDKQQLYNYGSGSKEVLKSGLSNTLFNSLYTLNNEHLSKGVKTIFEEFEAEGRSSAAINALIYRGDTEHTLTFPEVASLINILPKEIKTMGPPLLSYGKINQFDPEYTKLSSWKNVGFNDKFSTNEYKFLKNQGTLPNFTMIYYPDLDKIIHEKGPNDVNGIENVDKELQSLLNMYPSWNDAIENSTWIIIGDSAQSGINKEKNALIDLRNVFNDYRIAQLGKPITSEDQVVLAINERMAYIYANNTDITLQELADQLKEDRRIDFFAYIDKELIRVHNVDTNKSLTFTSRGHLVDEYGQTWSVAGDLSILDLKVQNGKIEYGNYPDALARLYGALYSHQGRFIVTDAKPGYEFIGEGSPTHLGGAGHGSLHKVDSVSPMIITGTDITPETNRIVDLKDFILTLTKKQ
ncbi:alkaline phosphatase family protein [Bacillus luteolus]|uniref:Alkaline phosphatase family protein n=1 Tax=Litchfieldia luteola TaxID=682179 RepID=A0ABR9QNC6_9BACI|nr:alkaline phosphatase family protein [Cytobacillus luteolus]MBE4909996.1 alkaline phosphatase family protein [Cytobacillus luteolus]MBP1942444.1 putative AlkP superfamily pyrophosphatase or phosphodiesterase [Cytobacillus luteolus]